MEAATITVENTPVNQKSCLQKVMLAITTYFLTYSLTYIFSTHLLAVVYWYRFWPFISYSTALIQGAPGTKDGEVLPLCGMLHIRNNVSALLGWRHIPSSTLVLGLQGESFLQATMKLRSSGVLLGYIKRKNFGKQHVKKFYTSLYWKRTERPSPVGVIMKHWFRNTNIEPVFTATLLKATCWTLDEPGKEAQKKMIRDQFQVLCQVLGVQFKKTSWVAAHSRLQASDGLLM